MVTPDITPGPDLSSLGAALQAGGPRSVLSHSTAARLLGIELVDDDGAQHLTVPRNRSRLEVPGWTVVRSDVPAGDQLAEDALRTTGVARTLADLARTLPTDRALVALESAIRLGLVPAAQLLARLAGTQGRGAAGVRAVGAHVDPWSGSVLETLLRYLLHEAGLPAPVSQLRITDGYGVEVARVDFAWPERRLVVEADGYAFHSDRAAYRADRTRWNALTELGWRVLRFTWEDVRHRPDHVVGLVRSCLTAARAA